MDLQWHIKKRKKEEEEEAKSLFLFPILFE